MSLTLHPEVIRLLTQIDDLKHRVGDLLETQAHLRAHAIPILTALYEQQIGPHEHALLAVRIEVSELKFRVESLMSIVNRGGVVNMADLERIDAQVRELQTVWQREMADKARQVEAAAALLKSMKILAVDEEQQLKTLYRRLCLHLHPDMNSDPALREAFWDHVQAAYGAADLKALEALWVAVRDGRGDVVDEQSGLEALTAERDRLETLVLEHSGRIAEARHNPPLCMEQELHDPVWIASRQSELQTARDAMMTRRDELRLLCDQLMARGDIRVH